MKYKVRAYITGVTLVKQFNIEAQCRDDAIDKANIEALREWAAGDLVGWDMTLDSKVDEDATEVMDGE